MRHLVHVQPTFEYAEKLDASGGPGALFKTIAERFKPEAFYIEAGQRAAMWVIDFKDSAALTEFTHIVLLKCGTTPKLTAVLTAEEAPSAIGRAMERARS